MPDRPCFDNRLPCDSKSSRSLASASSRSHRKSTSSLQATTPSSHLILKPLHQASNAHASPSHLHTVAGTDSPTDMRGIDDARLSTQSSLLESQDKSRAITAGTSLHKQLTSLANVLPDVSSSSSEEGRQDVLVSDPMPAERTTEFVKGKRSVKSPVPVPMHQRHQHHRDEPSPTVKRVDSKAKSREKRRRLREQRGLAFGDDEASSSSDSPIRPVGHRYTLPVANPAPSKNTKSDSALRKVIFKLDLLL
ncbi:unnamed protein product [Protopolystoma xenopodis]|uniref:Uncharacterized protein n=1 Tax=Protopolystoma xenopodis TaxID=117903 RepID=A0A448WEX9_9PLAT|nr:unnamed protein product [Protopolystoma xenopodis]